MKGPPPPPGMKGPPGPPPLKMKGPPMKKGAALAGSAGAAEEVIYSSNVHTR